MVRQTPVGYTKPERRSQRANSHHCPEAGSRLYCSRIDCPYCGPDSEEGE